MHIFGVYKRGAFPIWWFHLFAAFCIAWAPAHPRNNKGLCPNTRPVHLQNLGPARLKNFSRDHYTPKNSTLPFRYKNTLDKMATELTVQSERAFQKVCDI